MNNDPRGAIFQLGNFRRIDNAFVEDVVCFNNSNGYILVSYNASQNNQASSIQNIRLNLNNNTTVLNSFGQRMCICCIQRGMWISAVFSSRTTRSIPPQANAFLIVTQRRPQTASFVTTDRIASIDPANNFLYTGNPNDINRQTRFVITNETSITNRSGRPVSLHSLRPGQLVTITHANFQTASIPPQTTAFTVQLL